MVTFLLTWRLDEASAGRAGELVGARVVILAFLALIPASKHLHLVLSPITVFLKSPELGSLPNLDFEKEEVGLETVKDLGSKTVLDAFTCVECGRCQVNCPAWGAGKELNPKTIILQTQAGAARRRARARSSPRSIPKRCCGSARRAAPARTSARSASSTCRSSSARGAGWCRTARRPTIWVASTTTSSAAATSGGSATTSGRSSSQSAALEIFDPGQARRARLARMRGGVRGRLPEVAAVAVRDPARPRASASACCRRSGARAIRPSGPATSTCSRSWPPANIEDLEGRRPQEDSDLVSALREDDRRRLPAVRLRGRDRALGGVRRRAACAARRRRRQAGAPRGTVTFHDPCYLGRYAREGRRAARAADAVRRRHRRAGAQSREPVLLRRRRRPAVRGQGGGAGQPHQRRALQAAARDRRRHGRDRVPVLLDHAEGRAGERRAAGGEVQFVDLMTYVNGQTDQVRDSADDDRLTGARRRLKRAAGAADCDRSVIAWSRRSARRCAGGPKGSSTSTRSSASGRQPIMAFWHGRILPATYYFRRRGIVVITSENFDGEWIAGIIERFGYGTARGSTSRGAPKSAAAADARHGGREVRPAFTVEDRAVRRASPSRARCGWRRRPAIPCCRFISRPTVTGR